MNKNILIVDDSIVSRLMIKAIIKDIMPKATIIEANCGDDALEKIKDYEFIDIALIDYNMPGMNGLELAVEIEKTLLIPKRALLTANIQDAIKEHAAQVGVTFLNKPICEETIAPFLLSK